MFNKKECKNCKGKINENYNFCPYCGNPVKSNKEEWGMLGKNDFFREMDNIKLPFGFNSIFNSIMKNLDKEFVQKNNNPIEKTGISIDISNTGDGVPKIKIKTFGNEKADKKIQKIKEAPSKNLSPENIKKFLKLPRKEPKTEVRRFSDKVVYEIELPGVKTVEDISITKLESGLEIRAVAKDKAYFKTISVNLPLINYALEEGKLILELKE